MRRTSIVAAILVMTSACTGGSGDLAGDAGVSDSDYLEVDLQAGTVTAVAAPDDASLAAHRWRTSHMLFRRVHAGPAPGCTTGLPAGGEPEDALPQTGRLAWMGVFEVTSSQWQLLSQDSAAQPGEFPAAGLAPDDVHEVVRSTALSRFHLELPDGGTWMRACGGGQDTLFSWGSSTAPVVANGYAVHFQPTGDTAAGTRRVGSLRPNPGGFFDMHGNLAEATVTSDGGYVIHGGAWDSPILSCRTANVVPLPGRLRHPSVGYRLILRP